MDKICVLIKWCTFCIQSFIKKINLSKLFFLFIHLFTSKKSLMLNYIILIFYLYIQSIKHTEKKLSQSLNFLNYYYYFDDHL